MSEVSWLRQNWPLLHAPYPFPLLSALLRHIPIMYPRLGSHLTLLTSYIREQRVADHFYGRVPAHFMDKGSRQRAKTQRHEWAGAWVKVNNSVWLLGKFRFLWVCVCVSMCVCVCTCTWAVIRWEKWWQGMWFKNLKPGSPRTLLLSRVELLSSKWSWSPNHENS